MEQTKDYTHNLAVCTHFGKLSMVIKTSESVWLRLHGAIYLSIYRPDSFVLMLRYCANLKAIRYESTSLNRIVADKSHRV